MAIAATLVGSIEQTTNTATATVTATTTNGSTWVVWAATNAAAWMVPAITDNKGNTYTKIGADVTAFTVTGTLWYTQNGTGGASHTFTATPLVAGLNTLIVVEVTGGALTGILDQSAGGTDDVATPFTSAVTGTTTQANEVALAFEFDNRASGSAITWGGGYTSLVDLTNTAGVTAAAAKLILSATGTQQSTFTNANTTEAVSWVATFKEAAADTLMGQACL